MADLKRIAVDVMGGDTGPFTAVPAVLDSLARHPDLHLLALGDEDRIREYLTSMPERILQRLEIIHTATTVDAEASPASVLRTGRDSSLYRAVELVQQKRADACVSAGNTGALLLAGRHLLKMIPGIDRPAIIASIPTTGKPCYLLDVGANIDCSARDLFQFAAMGSALVQSDSLLNGKDAKDGKDAKNEKAPSVGLLNIGEEKNKGTEEVRAAAQLLESSPFINYTGYVEGNDLFSGNTDVIVCDGFVGNVTIKTSAGVSRVIATLLERQIGSSRVSRLLGRLAAPILSPFKAHINPARFNGASLLGLQGIVVKSHGSANAEGFVCAIEQAMKEIDHRVPELITSKLARICADSETGQSSA